MSRLFIELYLDEDVDVLVAALLRAQGFIAVTAQAAGRIRVAMYLIALLCVWVTYSLLIYAILSWRERRKQVSL